MAASDALLWHSLGLRHIVNADGNEIAQVESMIEPVGECGAEGLGVLAEYQRFECTSQRGLEISQQAIDPLKFGQRTRLERSHHPGRMDAAHFGNCRKTGQPNAKHSRVEQQAGCGPLGDGFRAKTTEQMKLQAHRLPCGVERYGCDECHVVFRAKTDFAPATLTTEVALVQLHSTAKSSGSIVLRHGVVDYVMQQPCGGVAHTQIALEGQRRDTCFGLADEVHGQEPNLQGQRGVLHHRSGCHRNLMSAATTLEQLSGTVSGNIVMSTVAAQAKKPVWTARNANRLRTMCLGIKVVQKLRDRYAGLELGLLARHQDSSSSREVRLRDYRIRGCAY